MVEESLEELYAARTRYLPAAYEQKSKTAQLLPLEEARRRATGQERSRLDGADRQELSRLVDQALQGPLGDVLTDIARRNGAILLGTQQSDNFRNVFYEVILKDGKPVYYVVVREHRIEAQDEKEAELTPAELMQEFTARGCRMTAYKFAEDVTSAIFSEIGWLTNKILKAESHRVPA